MIERIIENWLININERIYQVPFCQILTLEGHTVLHLSSHGVGEQGKDVLTLDKDGSPCAYQLKTGNITASVWKDIRGEINDLVELPIQHVGIDKNVKHRSILVTNGTISDDVRLNMNALNESFEKRGFSPFEFIGFSELLRLFIDAQGEFLPREPESIQSFLELYMSDGRTNISEDKYSRYIAVPHPVSWTQLCASPDSCRRPLAMNSPGL